MSSTIFGSKKRKWNDEETNSEVEEDFADDASDASNSDGLDDEVEDGEDVDSCDDDFFRGKSFNISNIIDLRSKDLADVLSDKDLLQKKQVTKKPQPVVVAPQKVLEEADWDM